MYRTLTLIGDLEIAETSGNGYTYALSEQNRTEQKMTHSPYRQMGREGLKARDIGWPAWYQYD